MAALKSAMAEDYHLQVHSPLSCTVCGPRKDGGVMATSVRDPVWGWLGCSVFDCTYTRVYWRKDPQSLLFLLCTVAQDHVVASHEGEKVSFRLSLEFDIVNSVPLEKKVLAFSRPSLVGKVRRLLRGRTNVSRSVDAVG